MDFSSLDKLSDLNNGIPPKKKAGESETVGPYQELPWDKIEEDPDQPRKHMDEVALRELADSMKRKGADGKPRGILQPIRVRDNPDKPGYYLINHGHRRHRALGIAGLKDLPVPAIIDNDSNRAEQLLENIQREDLDAFDISQCIEELIESGWKPAKIAEALGKNRAWISHFRAFEASNALVKELYRQGLSKDISALSDLARAWKKDPDAVEALVEGWLKAGAPVTRKQIQQALKPAPESPPSNDGGGRPSGADHDPAGDGLEPSNPGEEGTSQPPQERVDDESPDPAPSKPQAPADDGDTDKISRPCLWVSWKLEGEEYKGRLLMNRRPSKAGMVWVEEKDTGRPFEVVATGVTLEELTESK